MAYCCYHCGKQIKSKLVKLVIPPTLLVRLYGETTKAYHPRCYAIAEKQAEKELKGE